MVGWEAWGAFLGYAVPMIISPGPGNTLLAATGGSQGLRGSMAFWAGFEVGNIVLCAVYGWGLGTTLQQYPQVEVALKWWGVGYLLYLAYGFIRASAKPLNQAAANKAPGVREGFLCVIFNPKIHTMIIVMFAQFLNSQASVAVQILQLSAAFVALGIFCHFPWIYGGNVILGRFNSPGAMRIQAALFGSAMIGVAVYTVMH